MYSPEIREPWQRKRQTAAISPTYGDDDQSGQDKKPCSTHSHHRKTNFTCVYFQNVRLLLTGAVIIIPLDKEDITHDIQKGGRALARPPAATLHAYGLTKEGLSPAN